MNNYFEERMAEIQLRTEQMAEKKTCELEIVSLEEKLQGLDSSYERLKNTYESNLEQSALLQVDLVVTKEAYAYAESMFKEKKVLLVEEKRKLDELHWQVWEEQIKVCDEMGKCVAENDSVNFLNEYSCISNTQSYRYLAMGECNNEIKKLIAEHPEIKQLTAEVATLETEIKKAGDSCLSEDLHKALTEVNKLRSINDYCKSDETQRLIEALERSHRERMSLEAEITEIENRKIVGLFVEDKLKMSQKESKVFTCPKSEPLYYTSGLSFVKADKRLKSSPKSNHNNELQIVKDTDKKLEARKWYEEYVREIAQEDECKIEIPGCVKFGAIKKQFRSKCVVNRKSSEQFSQSVKSCFFDTTTKHPNYAGPGFLISSKSKRKFKPETDVHTESISRVTSIVNRTFEPLMATPSTFLKSAPETAFDNNSVLSRYDEGSSTSTTQGVMAVTKIAKFTPKRPSNIGKKLSYRQKKLDDFDNFISPVNKCITWRK